MRTAAGVAKRVARTRTCDAGGDLATVADSDDFSSTLGVKYIREGLGRLQRAEHHTYAVAGHNLTDVRRRGSLLSSHAGLGESSDAPNPPMNRWVILGRPCRDSERGQFL
jgi:hypothetical protein